MTTTCACGRREPTPNSDHCLVCELEQFGQAWQDEQEAEFTGEGHPTMTTVMYDPDAGDNTIIDEDTYFGIFDPMVPGNDKNIRARDHLIAAVEALRSAVDAKDRFRIALRHARDLAQHSFTTGHRADDIDVALDELIAGFIEHRDDMRERFVRVFSRTLGRETAHEFAKQYDGSHYDTDEVPF